MKRDIPTEIFCKLYFGQNDKKPCVSYGGVEGECDVLVVSAGGERDLRQSEVVLGAGQRGVQHQHIALEQEEEGDFRSSDMSWVTVKSKVDYIYIQ